MNPQPVVVINESHLLKFAHEKVHPWTSGSYHFSKGFLSYLGLDGFRRTFLTEPGQQQQNACQPFFAGVE